MESSNLQRGIQLFELGRYKEAREYFSKDLIDWTSRYYMAICHFNEENYKEASKLADDLLHEAPYNAEIFFLKARIEAQRDQGKKAMDFINQAIAINPVNADFFGFKGGLLLQEKQFDSALKFIDLGLRFDPKNSHCLNLRAQVLTKLKRNEEADETVENILYENPEDAYSHTNVGWVALENGDTAKALHHFKQALLLDPNFQYAREGMSTALKSKNIVYKWYLKYSFWIANKSAKNQWIFIIGLYIAYRFLFKMLSASGMVYLAIPVMIAYVLFALGGWIMESLSNAILIFDRYGKYLLSKNEKLSGYTFGTLFILSLISIVTFYSTGWDYFLLLAVTFLCSLLPLPRAFLLASEKAKGFAIIWGSIMLLIGIFGVVFIPDMYGLGIAVFIMMMAYTWIGNLIK